MLLVITCCFGSQHLAERRCQVNEFLDEAIFKLFPDAYREREKIYEQEIAEAAMAGRDEEHKIPIFVATLAIPSVQCPLHVFEPRYRLMMRRVMEAGTREFGMCISSSTDSNG